MNAEPKTLYLDLESGKAPDYKLYEPIFKQPRTTQKGEPDKRDKTVEEQRTEWESKLALSPLTGQILCYSYAWNDEDINAGWYIKDEVSEKEMLSLLVTYIFKADIIIGHYIKDFDLWFIANRCRKHGIAFPYKHYSKYKGKFSWQETVIDIADIWAMGKHKEYISLNNLAKFFGLEQKDSDIGKNFEQVFKEDIDKAVEYSKHDIFLTRGIYKKLR